MKKLLLFIFILSLFSPLSALAAATQPAGVSNTCWANVTVAGNTNGCTSAELTAIDAANSSSAQSVAPNENRAAQTNVSCDGSWVNNSDGTRTCIPPPGAGGGQVSCPPGQPSDGTCTPSGESTLPSTAATPPAGSGGGSTGSGSAQPTQTTSGSTGNTPAFCTGGVCSYIPLEPLPGGEVAQTGTATFASLLATAFKLLVTLGGLFAVVMLVISGIAYMLSETPLKMQAAKDRAVAALKGLLLLGAAWLIIYTINPKLLDFNLFTQDLQQRTGLSPASGGGAGTTNPVITITPRTTAETNTALIDCQNKGGRLITQQVEGGSYQYCDK